MCWNIPHSPGHGTWIAAHPVRLRGPQRPVRGVVEARERGITGPGDGCCGATPQEEQEGGDTANYGPACEPSRVDTGAAGRFRRLLGLVRAAIQVDLRK